MTIFSPIQPSALSGIYSPSSTPGHGGHGGGGGGGNADAQLVFNKPKKTGFLFWMRYN